MYLTNEQAEARLTDAQRDRLRSLLDRATMGDPRALKVHRMSGVYFDVKRSGTYRADDGKD